MSGRSPQSATTVAILGAGGWGTALGLHFDGCGHAVRLWCRRPERAAALNQTRQNRLYLPGVPIPASISITGSLQAALEGADTVVVAVPVQHIREALGPGRGLVPAAALRLGAAKGLERRTLLRVSEVLTDIWQPGDYAVLTGPSFALEVARKAPTALTLAGPGAIVERLQREVTNDRFRIYTSDDVIGAEVAGALKNVICIGVGMVRGLGYGANTVGALLTRGLAEMTRLGVAMGARCETFYGLAGMGDLVTTSSGRLSRNVRVGEAIAHGHLRRGPVDDDMIAEGVETARTVVALSEKFDVEMPISTEVAKVLFEGKKPHDAMTALMRRRPKPEC